MKLPRTISKTRRVAGIMLIECLVYLAVFAILTGIGMATSYFCWDHTRAVIFATEDVSSALRAGERWRADVRTATGKITVEATPDGELLRIPHGKDAIFYSYHAGALRRERASAGFSELVLAKTKASQMTVEMRGGVSAWRWEIELTPRRQETQMPLRFTFEAASTRP